MAKRFDQKEVKRFLRERNLTRAFKTWKSIRRNRKTVVDVAFPNYDGTDRRGKVYVYRRSGMTFFKDFNTLKTLGKSRKGVKNAIKSLFTRDAVVKKPMDYKGIKTDFDFKDTKIHLKNSSLQQSYNVSLQRLRTVERTNKVKKKKMGMVVCDILYIGKGKAQNRVQVRSSYGFLSKKSQRDQKIQECIRNGLNLAGFSPIEIQIKGIWFEYWSDKNVSLKKVR